MKSITRSHRITILLIVFLISACTASQPAAKQSPTMTPSETLTETATQQAEASPSADVTATCPPTPSPEMTETSRHTHYQMDVSLDYAWHTLSVSQIIDYTNNTGIPLANLPLLIPPAHLQDVFQLISMQLDPAHVDSNNHLENGVMTIQLDPVLEPDQAIQFSLTFKLDVPEGSSVMGFTERQLLLADWYPFIPPYLKGEGWLINPPGAVGEYLSYPLSDFTVNLHISPPDESFVIAASAPLISREGNCYRYQTSEVRNFSLAVSPEYKVTTRGSDLVTVMVYSFPEHNNIGERAAELILRAWESYTALYGHNPRQFISMVEADMHDGLECDGLFFLSDWYFETADETPKNYFELLTVHETSHQWFYGLTANDQANEPWLDEALATYSELLYLESHHPELVNWWWDFRVYSFNPQGYVNSTIYDHQDSRPYINAVYLNGVRFLKEIRQAIGDENFMIFLYNYTQAEEGFHTAASFFDLLSNFSDTDLSPILSAYFK